MGMERVTVEQNGERITLEVPEGTSDADIQSFLGGESVKTPSVGSAAFQTAAPLATASQLNLYSNIPKIPGVMGPVAPSGEFFKPTGFNPQTVKDVATPVTQLAKEIGGGYAAKPYKAVADAVLLHGGMPPVFGSIEAFKKLPETYSSVKDALGRSFSEINKATSASGLIGNPKTGNIFPESVPAYRAMGKAVPGMEAKLKTAYDAAGNNGVRNFLSSEAAKDAMLNPKFAAAAEQYLSQIPGYLKQAGTAVAPVLRGAARVLGPVGMGMNMYDAAQTARETQLGERLAGGQGQQAQRNFRQMNPGYGTGQSQGSWMSSPTTGFNSSITPDQAQTVLQSGSPRNIQAFGGQERLNQMIREAAAKKALAFPTQ